MVLQIKISELCFCNCQLTFLWSEDGLEEGNWIGGSGPLVPQRGLGGKRSMVKQVRKGARSLDSAWGVLGFVSSAAARMLSYEMVPIGLCRLTLLLRVCVLGCRWHCLHAGRGEAARALVSVWQLSALRCVQAAARDHELQSVKLPTALWRAGCSSCCHDLILALGFPFCGPELVCHSVWTRDSALLPVPSLLPCPAQRVGIPQSRLNRLGRSSC